MASLLQTMASVFNNGMPVSVQVRIDLFLTLHA